MHLIVLGRRIVTCGRGRGLRGEGARGGVRFSRKPLTHLVDFLWHRGVVSIDSIEAHGSGDTASFGRGAGDNADRGVRWRSRRQWRLDV